MNQEKRDDFSFGSRAWNEHYHGRNKDGHRKKADRAERAKKAMTKAKGKRAAEAAQEDLRPDLEKAAKVEQTAMGRVLPTRSTHAIKIAPASGHVTRRDVAGFEAQGWTVLPAGEALAKVGAGLPAVEAVEVWPNPSPDPLGPEGKARAVVIWSPEPFSREMVNAWRSAGYDVSAAPKAYRERREAKTNPGGMDLRERWKAEAKDYREKAKRNKEHVKRLKQAPPLKRDRMAILKLESEAADLLRWAREREEAIRQERGLFAENPGEKRKSKGQTGTDGDTRKKATAQAGDMAAPARKTPRRKATQTAKKNPAPPATVGQDLEKAWEKWTGSKASRAFEIKIPGAHDVPDSVVLLGRLSKLITATGTLKDFKGRGPLLVTDGEMERVWMLQATGHRFDLDMSKGIICYLAKKPKFGDRQPVEYVHQFDGKARAHMAGPVGSLSGSFRLTARGIEG